MPSPARQPSPTPSLRRHGPPQPCPPPPPPPLQEHLVLGPRRPVSLSLRLAARLGRGADAARFRDAWEHAVHRCAVLRTRFVATASAGPLRVRVADQDPVRWEAREPPAEEPAPGASLCRYALLGRRFVVRIHSAVVRRAYDSGPDAGPEPAAFWRAQMHGARRAVFPPEAPDAAPAAIRRLARRIRLPHPPAAGGRRGDGRGLAARRLGRRARAPRRVG